MTPVRGLQASHNALPRSASRPRRRSFVVINSSSVGKVNAAAAFSAHPAAAVLTHARSKGVPTPAIEKAYLASRARGVQSHFSAAVSVDDFLQRLEVALFNHGFQNSNSIACVNLCRDEVTAVFKHKIDQLFGSSFSIHGLGGVLTCGLTGVGAGLSHSPLDQASGKERYVFFSFPHIAIDAKGVVGHISRPGRSSVSCACGALIKSLSEIKREGLVCSCKPPGVHTPEDPEYSILKQRLARRLEFEGHTDASLERLSLAEFTQVAERTITKDLELLISKTVDTSKADYAVVTGVQIHNWGLEFDDASPNFEFVAPTNVYVVVDGVKKHLDLDLVYMPKLTPRQVRVLASAPDAHAPSTWEAQQAVCNSACGSTLREIDPPYMYAPRAARVSQKEKLAKISPQPAAAAEPSTSQAQSEEAKMAAPSPAQSEAKSQQLLAAALQVLVVGPSPVVDLEGASTPTASAAPTSSHTVTVQRPAAAASPAAAAPAVLQPTAQAATAAAAAAAFAPAVQQQQPQAAPTAPAHLSPPQPEPLTVPVEFAVRYEAAFGDRLAVVGAISELGSWDPARAAVLEWSEGHIWSATLDIPATALTAPGGIAFKVVKLLYNGGVEWEACDNHTLSVPSISLLQQQGSTSLWVSCGFGGPCVWTLQ